MYKPNSSRKGKLATMLPIKYMEKPMLLKLNGNAVGQQRNRAMNQNMLMELPKNRNFPVAHHLIHNDGQEVRCRVILDEHGNSGELDITIVAFNNLLIWNP